MKIKCKKIKKKGTKIQNLLNNSEFIECSFITNMI